jgi:hypothetical protein
VIEIIIKTQKGAAGMNVRVDDSASPQDMAAAWEAAKHGVLQRSIWDAIYFECVRRGIDSQPFIGASPSAPENFN